MKILLVLGMAVALAIVWFIATRGGGRGSYSIPIPPFTPRTDNDKVIVVQGWNEEELKKILKKFKETYERDGYPSWQFALSKINDTRLRIIFPLDIHPRLLVFLVNYLHYPFDFDLKNRAILAIAK